jgi:hypothetical protein
MESGMRRLIFLALIGATGCHGDWRAQAMNDAEAMVRAQIANPTLRFTRVQFTGDDRTGQTCGYFTRQAADGGEVATRFIVYIDGGDGQNPFIDDPATPFPINKGDFELNWRTQCVELGYKT